MTLDLKEFVELFRSVVGVYPDLDRSVAAKKLWDKIHELEDKKPSSSPTWDQVHQTMMDAYQKAIQTDAGSWRTYAHIKNAVSGLFLTPDNDPVGTVRRRSENGRHIDYIKLPDGKWCLIPLNSDWYGGHYYSDSQVKDFPVVGRLPE